MKSLGFCSAIIILVAINVCLADSPAQSNSSRLLGMWEKAYPNGDKIFLSFQANNAVEVKIPTGQVNPDITMWRLKGDTVLLFSSVGDLKGKMDLSGRLLIVGPVYGKPLYDLVLVKEH